jgi:C4-dicarboxylate transporter DctQ subunit
MGQPGKTAFLSKVVAWFIGVLLLATCVILFLNVVLRSLGYSMKWAEEFTRYAIVWITFMGSAICVERNMHVGIDALPSHLNERARTVLKVVVDVIGLLFSVVMVVLGVQMVAQAIRFQQKTAAMMISMAIPYIGIPLGCVLMVVKYFEQIWLGIKRLAAWPKEG